MTNPLERQRILVTFPGRAGDVIWALPTVRVIAELAQHPVDLQIAGEFSGMVELLRQQEYLHYVYADRDWSLTPPDDWRAPSWVPGREYDQVYHLGYRGWPDLPLPFCTYAVAQTYLPGLPALELHRPWITVAQPSRNITLSPLAAGFTDCWFELKLGIVECLKAVDIPGLHDAALLTPHGSRWNEEAGFEGCSWVEAAWIIHNAEVFLGDCSALHVLAVALGKPCVLVEPMQERLNPIFWPLGMDGRVQVVRGNDGLPTWDSRHTADALRMVLKFAGEAPRG